MAFLEPIAQYFYDLEGITLAERNKNFNTYLKDVIKVVSTAEDSRSLTNLIKPRNKLEEIFHTRILLEFRDIDGLLSILTGSNVSLRKMVLKSKLFLEVLEGNFDKLTSDDFSQEICFLVRIRILIRIGQVFKDDERLDNYYHNTRQKYGLHFAKHLLPACKLATITEEMNKNRVVFNNKQLSKLHQRFPNFLEEYFNHLKENNFKNFKRFDKIIGYVARTDIELYWKILKTHELKTKLSITSTNKFVEKYKEDLLKNGEKYIDIIHQNTAFKKLTLEEFPLLYAKLYPKSFNNISAQEFNNARCDKIKILVRRVPRKYRFDVLNEVFQKLYNTNLLDHDELITKALLEIVPANLREPIIKKKIAKDNKDSWIFFYELEKALTIIKEKISKTTDPHKRRNLVTGLVRTCIINNDIAKLAEVFDYIVTRHRNEDTALYNNIFVILDEIDTEKFSADHWEAVNKMSKIYLLNKQENYYYNDYRMIKFIEGYWNYNIKNNLPITEEITNYMKKHCKDYNLLIFQDKKFKKQRKIVLDIMAEVFPILFEDVTKHADCLNVVNFFMQSIAVTNTTLKKDKINLGDFPFIIKYISDTMDCADDEENQRGHIFGMVADLRHIKQKDVYQKVCDELWTGKADSYAHKWNYFLKYHPQYIADNYEQFFSHNWLQSDFYDFIKNVQFYSHLGIPQSFYKKSKELLMGPEYSGHNLAFQIAVRFLVSSDEFLSVIDKFLPKKAYDSKIVDEEANVVQIKKTTSEVLGSCENLENALKPLLALAKSDYLKYCLRSIYRIVYNLPESKLANFKEELTSGKISLSKHVIFITTRISDQQNVYKTLKTVGINEKNLSVQKYLLKSTINYFKENPSDEFFELLKDHCQLLTDYDSEGFDLMVNFEKIPIKYLSKYVEFIWELTQNSNIDEIKEVKYKILQKLNEDLMRILKPEFLDNFVSKCLNFEKQDADKMYDFIYRYIIIGDLENTSKRINFVVAQFPKIIVVKDMQIIKNLLNFTLGLCKKIFEEHKKKNLAAKIVLIKFREAWNKIYNLENSFEQAMALDLAVNFIETENYDKTLMVQKVALILNSLLSKHSQYVIPNFAAIFQKLLFVVMKIQQLQDDEELFKFLLEILQAEINIPQIYKEYFVLLTLPKIFPKATNAKEKHLKILETLEKSDFISIKMNVICYINSLQKETEEDVPKKFVPICSMRC